MNKKIKKKNLLGISGIIAAFVIAIACSTADDNGGNPPDSPEEKTFKSNLAGSYTANNTAVLNESGFTMDFSTASIRIASSTDETKPYYLHISINGPQAANTLHSIRFDENTNNGVHIQTLEVHSPTNATLRNVTLQPTSGSGGSTVYNAIGEVMLNLTTKELSYNNTVIGTKN